MDLTTLAAKAAQIGLPAVRAALLGPIGNAALVAVTSKLGVPATPAALGAAMDDPETRLALARIDAEMQAEGNRHAEAVLADRVTAPITTRQASTLADERHPHAPTSLRGQLGVAADEQHGLRAALTYVVEQSA